MGSEAIPQCITLENELMSRGSTLEDVVCLQIHFASGGISLRETKTENGQNKQKICSFMQLLTKLKITDKTLSNTQVVAL